MRRRKQRRRRSVIDLCYSRFSIKHTRTLYQMPRRNAPAADAHPSSTEAQLPQEPQLPSQVDTSVFDFQDDQTGRYIVSFPYFFFVNLDYLHGFTCLIAVQN